MTPQPQIFWSRHGTAHSSRGAANLYDLMQDSADRGRNSGSWGSHSSGSTFGTFVGGAILLGLLIWGATSIDWSAGDMSQSSGTASQASLSAPKSWCLGLVNQIEAREAMPNPGAWRQIPPIRQEFVEHNCQSYGIGMP
jgi:hypothetical protein